MNSSTLIVDHDSPAAQLLGNSWEPLADKPGALTQGVVRPGIPGGSKRYLPNLDFDEYLISIKERHPSLHGLLDLSNASRMGAVLESLADVQTGFGTATKGGRGDDYRAAQKRHPLARRQGVRQLFRIVEQDRPSLVFDALSGSGSMTRVRRCLEEDLRRPSPRIVTSDLDDTQIASALADGFAAIRQAAQQTFFRDACFDAALFAFGTHHIPVDSRLAVWREARRVLKPGGRIVVHDFETGWPTERFYSEVIHLLTDTGHDCEHFTAQGLWRDLLDAGFRDVRLHYVYEPFVLEGISGDDAIVQTIRHIVHLFGLVKLRPADDSPAEWLRVAQVLARYFTIPDAVPLDKPVETRITVRRTAHGYEAVFPRVSLVATAVR